MKDRNESGSGAKSNPAARLWILALAGLIGFGAVYVMRGGPDNVAVTGAAAPKPQEAEAKTSQMAAYVKKKAPEALPEITFNDASGKSLSLADFKGKTILLNLWATWCAPCREEIPILVKLQKKYGAQGLQFVGIAVDQAEKVRPYAAEMGMNFPILIGGLDAIELTRTLGNRAGVLPFTVIVARDGRIAGKEVGAAKEGPFEARLLPLLQR